jgi:hypothetical protein
MRASDALFGMIMALLTSLQLISHGFVLVYELTESIDSAEP